MEWLLLLICPLMMLFMMKGHLGGHKHSHGKAPQLSDDVISKVKSMELENEKLRKEISELSSMVKKES